MRSLLVWLCLTQSAWAWTVHPQVAQEGTTFVNVHAIEQSEGTVRIDEGTVFIGGRNYQLPAYTTPVIGDGPFSVWIERTGDTMADYLVDLTGYAIPKSFGENIGAVKLIWRDRKGDDIHVLQSVRP